MFAQEHEAIQFHYDVRCVAKVNKNGRRNHSEELATVIKCANN